MIGALQQLLGVTATAIGSIRLPGRGESAEDVPNKTFDPNVVRDLFDQLSSALDELNPDVVEPIVCELAEYLGETELSVIRREVDAFDFEAAKNQLDALAKKRGL